MTLLQRISRNVKNIILLFPRSGTRRRGLNMVFVVLFFFTITVYLSERQSGRVKKTTTNQIFEKRDLGAAKKSGSGIHATKSVQEQMIVKSTAKINPLTVTRLVTPAVQKKSPVSSTVSSTSQTVKESPEKLLRTASKNKKNCEEISPELIGDMNSNPNITPSMEEVIQHVGPNVLAGGCFAPTTCKALQKVAVLIPFKDRDAHLKTLLHHLHPMLMRQQIQYCIYVAEQFDNGQFNKALIMNAAFVEALKLDDYDCIIFHDVDMIPENDKNLYMCGKTPRHLSPAIDKFEYKPHYGTEFGGVTGITPAQYRKANGHSNRFWGWGGEDNDMEFRIEYRNMSITPSSMEVGRYMMIPHLHPWKFKPNKFPYRLNNTRKTRANVDGLSDLQYQLAEILRYPLYTKLVIDIRIINVTKLTLYINGKPAMDVDLYPNKVDPSKCRWEMYENLTMEKHDRIDDSCNAFTTLEEAKRACEIMHGSCGGIVKEIGGKNYTLRKKGPPKHSDLELSKLLLSDDNVRLHGALGNDLRLSWIRLWKAAASGDFKLTNAGTKELRSDYRVVIPVDEEGLYENLKLEDVLARNTTTYIKYCPGFYASYQKIPIPLKQIVGKNITKWVYKVDAGEARYFFAYKLTVEVMLKPLQYLYYADDKHFEARLDKGSNHHTFTWPNDTAPDPSKSKKRRSFTFRTPDFAVPNLPGTYGVESRIADKLQNPYFQWNWWFEVTSGNKVDDAKIREAYWRKKMTENVIKNRAKQHQAMLRENQERARKNQMEFNKKMDEIHKGKNLGIPPKIEKFVKKMQENYNKHDIEAVEEDLEPNNPLLQRRVGLIKLSDGPDDSQKEPKVSTTTTQKTALKTRLVANRQFHLIPKSKVQQQ